VTPSRDIARLLEIMAALRTPGSGCPWDLQQNFASIAPYTIEEAYEVADAIARNDLDNLREELGDLLLQVVFHSHMAEEEGVFDFGAVVEAITAKLLRRHPHVFGRAGDLTAEEVSGLWDRTKAEERAERASARNASADEAGVLDGVPAALPALSRAQKLQSKAAGVGFDWGKPEPILHKIAEEIAEVECAANANDHAGVQAEIGDLLFALVNLARHYQVDAEAALRQTNRKFESRFRFIERSLQEQGRTPAESDLVEMDELWNASKRAETLGKSA
jgi:ATP diphosphatase